MKPKEWRLQAKVTLEQIAEKAGYSGTSYISEFENGKKPASLKLARAYHELSGGQVNLLKQ